MIQVRDLQPADAAIGAELHAIGQPGTVLTTLGPAFLKALYVKMAESPMGIAKVATKDDEVIGIIAGTTDTHALFRELIVKQGVYLALPILGSLLRHPALAFRVLQTFAYPNKLNTEPGEAEFLFIGVSATARRQGVGSIMFEALVAECRRRGATGLKSTVDASNPHANAFHVKWGFEIVDRFDLYGRAMNLYFIDLTEPPQTATT
jgi:ribosomal protein S18 acetylase RimI-like enzyme